MAISIDVTANASGFVKAAGEAADSITGLADALDQIAAGDLSGDELTAALSHVAQQARDTGTALESGMQRGTQAMQQMVAATARSDDAAGALKKTLSDLSNVPMSQLDDRLQQMGLTAQQAEAEVAKLGTTAGESGEKIQEGGKLGEAAMMNVGFSAMQAGSLFTDGISGMAEQVGTFAAFMGPSLAGVGGALGSLAWPITLAGVGVAALAGLFANASTNVDDTAAAVKDFITQAQTGTKAVDGLDAAVRDWMKSAQDFGDLGFGEAAKAAQDAGAHFSDYADALTSHSVPAMEAQKQALQALHDEYTQNINDTQGQTLADANARDSARQSLDAVDTLTGALNKKIAAQKEADVEERAQAQLMNMSVTQFRSYGNVLQDAANKHVALSQAQQQTIQEYLREATNVGAAQKAIESYTSAASAAQQAQQTFSGDLTSSLASAGEAADKFGIDGPQSLQKYAQSVANAVTAIQTQAQNLSIVAPSLTQAGLNYVESLGAQAAPALAEAVKLGAGSPGYTNLMNAWNAAGAASAQNYGKAVTSSDPPTLPTPKPPDMSKLSADFWNVAQIPHVTPVIDPPKLMSDPSAFWSVAKIPPITPVINAPDTSKADAAAEALSAKFDDVAKPRDTTILLKTPNILDTKEQLDNLSAQVRIAVINATAHGLETVNQQLNDLTKDRTVNVYVNQVTRPGTATPGG